MPPTPARALALVAEDYPDGLELITDILEHAGLDVIGVGDGESAIREIQRRRPAIVVLDLHLPGLGGYEVTRRLKADPSTWSIPVLMLTADASDVAQATALVAGADQFLTKPILPEDLLNAVRRHLALADPSPRGG